MPEKFFGHNAGKVWHVLNKNGPMPASKIAQTTRLNINEAYGALGWLGREGKIAILSDKGARLFALTESMQVDGQSKQTKLKK